MAIFGSWVGAPDGAQTRPTPPIGEMTNTEALGRILYTDYVYLFQASGMVLLVAMIGAIVLTLRHREGVRRQSISSQVGRTKADSIEVVKVRSGSGI
jgi:NADH-quinone oxidoreductase subunit J